MKIDLSIGGKWRIADIQEHATNVATGVYGEIARPGRLAFTFATPQFSANVDTISVALAADGTGSVMTFLLEGADVERERAATQDGQVSGAEQGWTTMFDRLEEVLAGA